MHRRLFELVEHLEGMSLHVQMVDHWVGSGLQVQVLARHKFKFRLFMQDLVPIPGPGNADEGPGQDRLWPAGRQLRTVTTGPGQPASELSYATVVFVLARSLGCASRLTSSSISYLTSCSWSENGPGAGGVPTVTVPRRSWSTLTFGSYAAAQRRWLWGSGRLSREGGVPP